MPGRNRKVEQGDATRQTLVRSAITLFAGQGYAATSTADIVALSHVTRGALYHHFPDKERLFAAALDAVEEDVYRRVLAAVASGGTSGGTSGEAGGGTGGEAGGGTGGEAGAAAGVASADVASRVRTGCAAFLDACLDRPVQRILLQEGPAILGWEQWQRMDNQHCARHLLANGITEAIRTGALPQQPPEPLTHLLYGALVQAGLVIAGAENPRAARESMGHATAILLDSLFTHVEGPRTEVS